MSPDSRRPVIMAALLGILHAAAAVATARQEVADQDLFWLAAAGRDMLASGSVPRQNLWSFVDGARPWTMHEWLYGPPFAAGLRSFGPGFFLAFAIVTAALIGALVTGSLLAQIRRRDVAIGTALVVTYVCASRVGFARPTWSMLVLPLVLSILAFRPTFGRRACFASIALCWFWANAHGSFPMGWAILGAALVEKRERLRAIALAGAVLSSFVNPYGLGLHRLVVAYATGWGGGGVAFARKHVVEYAPIWNPKYHTITPVILIVACAVCLVASGVLLARRKYVVRAGLVFLLSLAGALASRHVVFAPMLAPILLAPAIDELTRKTDPAESKPGKPGKWLLGIYVPGLVLGFVVLAVRMAQTSPEKMISPAIGGADVVELVRATPEGAHVYTPFRSAGLVVWEGTPRGIKVLYDSRNDCYSEEVASFVFGTHAMTDEQVLDGLDHFDAQLALVPSVEHVEKDSLDVAWKKMMSVARAPSASARWKVRTRAGGWILYERAK